LLSLHCADPYNFFRATKKKGKKDNQQCDIKKNKLKKKEKFTETNARFDTSVFILF
jgi:hypothetical protein